MSDCSNAEIRDRLPDLLHERLDPSARAAVVAHVEECADCHAELALLREARLAVSSATRSVDVVAVTRVVVLRTAIHARAAGVARRPIWSDWRIAASIALIAIGGASFAAIRMTHQGGPIQNVQIAVPPPESVSALVQTAPALPQPHVARVPATPAQTAELSAAGGVSDLSERDLQKLLEDLQSMDAVPPTDPEPVTVRVSQSGLGSSE